MALQDLILIGLPLGMIISFVVVWAILSSLGWGEQYMMSDEQLDRGEHLR